MKILFSCRQFLPRVGGVQLSVHQLALRLRTRGHAVAVLTADDDYGSRSRILRAVRGESAPRPAPLDNELGYPVFRIQNDGAQFRAVVTRFEPDVVVANVGGRTTLDFSRQVIQASQPRATVAYIRDIEGIDVFSRRADKPDAVLTNAERIRELSEARGIQVAAVIPSVVETDAYRTWTSRRVVLFVNPRSERKGASIAWALAEARPHIPFVFLEAWRLTPEQRAMLEERASALGNVTIRPSVREPQRIYQDARILFVPYEDSRPRVVAEAQVSGIPALAARVPGLVETVGPGGLFVEPDAQIEIWAETLDELWNDEEQYQRVAAAAEEHSHRDDVQPARLAERVESELQRVVAERVGA